MNKLIISLFIFIFSLAFTYPSTGATVNKSASFTSTAAAESATYEDIISVRVCIDGHWWTYYYTANGSFIVAIPDDYE